MDIDIAGKLFPNITTLIVQLCATGIMLLIFKKFLWIPIQNYFKKRADYIESQIIEAKDMNTKAKALIVESEQKAKESAVEYQNIINKAKQEANDTKQKIIKDAQIEANNKLIQADKEIEAQKLKAQEDIKKEIVEVAIEVASKVMNKEMNNEQNQKMVEDFVDKVVN